MELVAHQVVGDIFEPPIAELPVADKRGDAPAHGDGVAAFHQGAGPGGVQGGEVRAVQAEIGGTHELALGNRYAACDLAEIFAERGLGDQRFKRAQAPAGIQFIDPGEGLA